MLTGGVKMTVNSYGVTIVEKEAFIEGEKEGMIRITCDGETYSVKYLLVCTGSDTVTSMPYRDCRESVLGLPRRRWR